MYPTIRTLQRQKYVGLFGLSLLILCHGDSWGHANATIESIDVVKSLRGEQVGIETTVGYLRSADMEQFEWICHETITQPDAVITPRYTENTAGVVLAAVGDLNQARSPDQSVYKTTDGCSGAVSDSLTGQLVADVKLSPTDDSLGVLTTENDGDLNGIFVTNDAGDEWSPAEIVSDDRLFRSVRFSRGEAGSVWVTAIRHETMQAWAYRSIDDGLTWTEHEVPVPDGSDPFTYLDVLEVDADDPDTAWFVMGPYLSDRLLKTTDGGSTFTEVYAIDRDIIDGAQDADGGLWLVLSGNTIVYAADGTTFSEVDTAPMSLGVETDADTVMLASRVYTAGGPLAVSDGGPSFEVIDVFSTLEPALHCGSETDYAEYCSPLWEDLDSRLSSTADGSSDSGDSGDDEPPDSTQSGCCRSEAKRSSVGLLVIMVLALGRRRI